MHATAFCPGATATEFASTAGNANSLLFKLGAARAEDVALVAYRASRAGKVVAIPGWMNWLGAVSLRFTPRFIVRRLVAWINSDG